MKIWVSTSSSSSSFSFSFFFFFFYVCGAAWSHSTTTGSGKSGASEDLVRTSCIHASYPELCLRTLTSYGGPAKTPNDLAQAAVNVSMARARKVSGYLSRVATSRGGKGNNKRQRVAVSDCVEQLSDSVDELRKTLSELRNLRSSSGTFKWHMSNAETWVSAALTNEDTCLDGFQDVGGSGSGVNGIGKEVKSDVKRKVNNVAKVTSNALYLINRLDDARGHGRTSP